MSESTKLYVSRNNQQFGPYAHDQVRSWLSSGQMLPTDLACAEGATSWAPLHTLAEMAGVQVPALPAAQGGSRSAGWGLMISGGVCSMVGLLLSLTLIGAIIGIPLFIGGIIMTIIGRVRYNRHVMASLTESIRSGIAQGIQRQ